MKRKCSKHDNVIGHWMGQSFDLLALGLLSAAAAEALCLHVVCVALTSLSFQVTWLETHIGSNLFPKVYYYSYLSGVMIRIIHIVWFFWIDHKSSMYCAGYNYTTPVHFSAISCVICIFRPVVVTGTSTCHFTLSQILNKSTKIFKNQNKPPQGPSPLCINWRK